MKRRKCRSWPRSCEGNYQPGRATMLSFISICETGGWWINWRMCASAAGKTRKIERAWVRSWICWKAYRDNHKSGTYPGLTMVCSSRCLHFAYLNLSVFASLSLAHKHLCIRLVIVHLVTKASLERITRLHLSMTDRLIQSIKFSVKQAWMMSRTLHRRTPMQG